MPRRPNIVLIVLDSVRRDHLSCYGYNRPTTPNIDRIAGQGFRFSRASAVTCWTLPSHASIFTGLYPSQHHADLDTQYLRSSVETLASTLSAAGYATASFSCNGFVSPETNLTRGFDIAVDVERLAGGSKGLVARVVRSLHRRWRKLAARDRGATRATRRAVDWLRKRSDDRRPFFLFLNYMDCHQPYRLRGPARHRFVSPEDRSRVESVPQDPFAAMAGVTHLSQTQIADLTALYDGCLHYLDHHVGVVDETLRALGLSDDTIFVITADHGESFGEHGLLDHQYGLYEPLLNVPLIIRVPGHKGESVRDDLVQHVDLFPTVLDAIDGLPRQSTELPGVSTFGSERRRFSFAEYLVPNLRAIRRRFPEVDTSRFDVRLRSVSTERYKLIEGGDDTVELYDLQNDPDEQNNLAAHRPDLIQSLTEQLCDTLGGWPPDWRDEHVENASTGELDERLRALGYL